MNTPPRKPKKKKHGNPFRDKQGARLRATAHFMVSCFNCGFSYESSRTTCPKCGTKKENSCKKK